jgi:phospholipid/cholesterol/gamma-HCH transport system substrate-binding protein
MTRVVRTIAGAPRSLFVRMRRGGLFHPTALKVAAFALVCLVLLAGLAARIGNITFFSHRTTYSAQLSDATGLIQSDDVKIAGVTVGEVTGVKVQRAHALVTFALNDSVHLRSGTRAGLQWANVIGQKFLYLYPSTSGRSLPPGTTIPLTDSVSGADVGALLDSLGPLLGALHPQQANEIVEAFANTLSGNETQVDQLIGNAASVSQTVGSVDTQVGELVTDLNQVMSALSSRSSDLGQVISNLQSVSSSLAGRNDLLDQTVGNLGKVSGEVASLEGDTHDNLSAAITDLQAVSAEIQSRESQLSQGLSTLGSGLAGYQEISSYGQWFQIQVVYGCLAGEEVCNYYEGSSPPPGTGPGGSAPSSGAPSPAGSSSPLGLFGSNSAAGQGSGSSSNVSEIYQMISGKGGFSGSTP